MSATFDWQGEAVRLRDHYDLGDLDPAGASEPMRAFVYNFFVSPMGLLRHEADLGFIDALGPGERDLAAAALRRNLPLGHTHIVDGVGFFRDEEAVEALEALLDEDPNPSRRLGIARALWRIRRDPLFPELLEAMVASGDEDLRVAHGDDLLLLGDERSVRLLVAAAGHDSFAGSLALRHLNQLEHRTWFPFVRVADLPGDLRHFRARVDDPEFVAWMVESLGQDRASWPVQGPVY